MKMKMTRDIDTKTAPPKDLLTWYNENSGSTKPIKKFKDEATARKRCGELYQALVELDSGSSKGKVKGKEKKAEAEGKGQEASGAKGRSSSFAGKKITPLHKDKESGKLINPRREGTFGHTSHEIILKKPDGISYEDFITNGGRSKDLRYDFEHGFVDVK